MTKKLWILMLALAVVLMPMAALAVDSMATPSDMYEYEENDGHAHVVRCDAPSVCIWCGATVTATYVKHEFACYPYSETHHEVRCALCGEVNARIEHTAYCDDAAKCGACGATGVTIKGVYHDEELAYDADGHYWRCLRCGKVTSSKQAHWAHCYEEAGKCERCGAPFSGDVWHFKQKDIAGYDATYHWFKCDWCGKDIKEKHYLLNYYWYEHEGDNLDLLCGGCGMKVQWNATGNAGTASSGSYIGVDSSWIAGSQTVPRTAESMTAAALHGNTEGLPMALIYAPKTGKATLRDSVNGKALTSLRDGTVVIILGEDYRFTQVRVGDMVGSVLNGVIQPIDPWQLPLGEGMLTYPTTGGRGTTTINVRGDASNKAVKIGEWATGTMVIIWSVSDNGEWYEVEYEGVRGYVHAQFLTVADRYDFSAVEEPEEETVAEA